MSHLNFDELANELKVIEAEAIGWLPLEQGAYIHYGAGDQTDDVIHIVGVPDAQLAEFNVVLLVG